MLEVPAEGAPCSRVPESVEISQCEEQDAERGRQRQEQDKFEVIERRSVITAKRKQRKEQPESLRELEGVVEGQEPEEVHDIYYNQGSRQDAAAAQGEEAGEDFEDEAEQR